MMYEWNLTNTDQSLHESLYINGEVVEVRYFSIDGKVIKVESPSRPLLRSKLFFVF